MPNMMRVVGEVSVIGFLNGTLYVYINVDVFKGKHKLVYSSISELITPYTCVIHLCNTPV